MEYENILYGVEDKIATITLNRPEKRNALSPALRRELIAALRNAEADDDVSVILIQGAGPAFCAGYDMNSYAGGEEHPERPDGWNHSELFENWTGQFPRSCLRDWLAIWDLLKPVVAKVHGYALAGGSELMSMCDIVFAAEDTVMGYPPTRAQATPDVEYFPWKMSMAQAKYLQLTGNSVTGKRAEELGWIAKSFPSDELDEQVMRELRPMAQLHPAMLAANKQALNQSYEAMGFRAALQSVVPWYVLARSFRPGAGEFQTKAAAEGLKSALKWRDGAFQDEGFIL
ncbi:enoyl-CoA hydratase/isomerase family protein [Aeromicrobium sp. YIM 150415]|uniref:enoyl-CoA hydratase-related protein n=1 Tax=Aeromicrobium sp. YIM 150415 TaxID=2803912 RepID=UPI00196294B1|nr:enoyl-CoA hydratase-related protein [Aeromicrobium sp. YIM 150415]MBM9464057.1 enoyl-CoA hydratase/isomerase family protein [Aeromicrobium sp. YIM 150415]